MSTVKADEALQHINAAEGNGDDVLSWEAQILKGVSAAVKEKKIHVATITAQEQTIATQDRTISLQDARIKELSRLNMEFEATGTHRSNPSWALLIGSVIGAFGLGAALVFLLL